MKLNLAKYVFDMKARKFLGFIVSKNEIEPNLEKLKALMDISPPRTLKEVQILIRRIATLNRFISQMADRCLLFFKILHNIIDFEWTEECQLAFEDFKRHLESPQFLIRPNLRDTLFLYLGVSHSTISVVMVKEKRDECMPIYYMRVKSCKKQRLDTPL